MLYSGITFSTLFGSSRIALLDKNSVLALIAPIIYKALSSSLPQMSLI